MKNKDVLEITDGLSDLFEEYAALELEQGGYFSADVWKKAAEIAKSYTGAWNKDIPVPNWKGSVKEVKENKNPEHFGCIPIRVDDL
jgi:hypothetical protein